jgi:hypothetical protein
MTPVADKPLTPELREGKMKSIRSLAKLLGSSLTCILSANAHLIASMIMDVTR